MNDTHRYDDLLSRIRQAQLGRCTCLTNDPEPALHRLGCVYRVLGEAAQVISQQPFDHGPWRYVARPGADQLILRYYLESADFHHDVRLYLNGDFADDASRALYAAGLVAKLNTDPSAQLAEAIRTAHHWRANHDQMVHRLRLFTQREDLPVDRLPAYHALIDAQDRLTASNKLAVANRYAARAKALEDVMAMLGARATMEELADYCQTEYIAALEAGRSLL